MQPVSITTSESAVARVVVVSMLNTWCLTMCWHNSILQGFVQYRMSGVTRVDVETLNDNLRTHGKMRLRHALRPDEAFGMIFNFDG